MTPYKLRNAVLYVCPVNREHRMILCEPVGDGKAKAYCCSRADGYGGKLEAFSDAGRCMAAMVQIPLQIDGRDFGELFFRFALQQNRDTERRVLAIIESAIHQSGNQPERLLTWEAACRTILGIIRDEA